MFRYIIKRLLWFIPTLLVVVLIGFFIQHLSSGDTVDRFLGYNADENRTNHELAEQQRNEWTHRLGLDLPLFYFSIQSLAKPDTFYRIPKEDERNVLEILLNESGNWKAVSEYYSSIQILNARIDSLLRSSPSGPDTILPIARHHVQSLLHEDEKIPIKNELMQLQKFCAENSSLKFFIPGVEKSVESFNLLNATSMRWKNFIPVIYFYRDNQFQRYVFGDGIYSKGLIRGDFGLSNSSHEPIGQIISEHIGWSLFFTLISVLLSYLISIPIGIRAAAKRNSFFDRTSSLVLFLLHSLPVFWVATLLLLFFANPDVLAWFPTGGVHPAAGFYPGESFLQKTASLLPYCILPLIAYTYGGLAFITRLTRASVIEELQKDYVKTARAKGLKERVVIRRHAFRNTWLPLITVFANVFPAAIGGTIVLERIFSIPGMGLVNFNAILQQDEPVIAGVFIVTASLVLAGNLLCDILYAWTDRRIRFN